MDSLNHVIENLDTQEGFVLVLDTGAVIDAQAESMLQALHSRSTGGILHHLEILKEKGAESFMEKFYVGYGHKSIGDCGNATVFVEGISMLAAKAIQDWRLYSGQEASTRYVDFSQQVFVNPCGSDVGNEILEDWRKFYLDIQEPTQEHLKKLYPIKEGEKKSIYNKAITARAFDIARAFLPAGASTNVAWRMNLRQFADHFMLLRHHPLAEVREIAKKTEIALGKMFPQSFGQAQYETTEKYNKKVMGRYYYANAEAKDFELSFNGVNTKLLETKRELLESRPMKTELAPCVAETGVLTYDFLLDFGSFRDIQRHRSLVQRMPILNTEHGFEPWYIESLPKEWQTKTMELIKSQEEKVKALGLNEVDSQYYLGMGYRIACRVTGDIRALVYVGELRATRFVHPTLVKRATQILDSLEENFAEYGLVIHRDAEPNRFDVRRGEHDIVMKD